MSWVCPICKRPFKNVNQQHSCTSINPETVFENRPEKIKKIYNKLYIACSKFGNMQVTATKDAVFFKNDGTFASIKPKKEAIVIEFFLPTAIDEFPVYKTVILSKNRVVHYVQADDLAQVDKQLLSWLKTSYELVGK
jgi:Domain of unknown function (DUF5655)